MKRIRKCDYFLKKRSDNWNDGREYNVTSIDGKEITQKDREQMYINYHKEIGNKQREVKQKQAQNRSLKALTQSQKRMSKILERKKFVRCNCKGNLKTTCKKGRCICHRAGQMCGSWCECTDCGNCEGAEGKKMYNRLGLVRGKTTDGSEDEV